MPEMDHLLPSGNDLVHMEFIFTVVLKNDICVFRTLRSLYVECGVRRYDKTNA